MPVRLDHRLKDLLNDFFWHLAMKQIGHAIHKDLLRTLFVKWVFQAFREDLDCAKFMGVLLGNGRACLGIHAMVFDVELVTNTFRLSDP